MTMIGTRVLCLSVLLLTGLGSAGCDEAPAALGKDRGAGIEAGADQGPADSGAAPEAGKGDGPGADAPAREASTVDLAAKDTLAADLAAQDAKKSDILSKDSGSALLQASITAASAWANMMPPRAPDPTHASLTFSLTNKGSATVTGVALTGVVLTSSSGTGYAHPLTMKAAAGFSGSVPAGQTVSASFASVAKTATTPLPFPCNTKVLLRATVSYTGGSTGPVSSSIITFTCTY